MSVKKESEFKNMSLSDLKKESLKLRKELSTAMWDKSLGKGVNVRLLKRKIAKFLTEINSR